MVDYFFHCCIYHFSKNAKVIKLKKAILLVTSYHTYLPCCSSVWVDTSVNGMLVTVVITPCLKLMNDRHLELVRKPEFPIFHDSPHLFQSSPLNKTNKRLQRPLDPKLYTGIFFSFSFGKKNSG